MSGSLQVEMRASKMETMSPESERAVQHARKNNAQEMDKVDMKDLKEKKTIANRFSIAVIVSVTFIFLNTAYVFAVPETTGVTITDVTPHSFSIVWMTDVPADPAVEVFSDMSMSDDITGNLTVIPMPAQSQEIVDAARSKGIMKVRISGLAADATYYTRTVTRDPSDGQSIAYSPLLEVRTASKVVPYQYVDQTAQGFSNDLLSFRIHIRPSNSEDKPGQGDILLLQEQGSGYPISAFVGDGIDIPEGVLDLNNLFGNDGQSQNTLGGEILQITIYRGGGFSNLYHFRKIAQDNELVEVHEAEKGFFADVNLDGNVDETDFQEFRDHYKTMPDDDVYNPDFNYVEDPEARIDAKDFSKFSREYGRTNVQ